MTPDTILAGIMLVSLSCIRCLSLEAPYAQALEFLFKHGLREEAIKDGLIEEIRSFEPSSRRPQQA
jgi:hypothetical protein